MTVQTCTKCAKALPAHAKYCPACGTAVRGERPKRQEITVKVGSKSPALDGTLTVRVKNDDFDADGATIAARASGGVEEVDYLGRGDEVTCTADDETQYVVRVLAIDEDEQTVTMLVMLEE